MRIETASPKGRMIGTMSHGEKAMVMATMLNGYLSVRHKNNLTMALIKALETKLQEYVGFRFID